MANIKEKQIKSRKRVQEQGEVFTAEREVKAMCDLVGNMCDDYSKRFLEPACGNGNQTLIREVLQTTGITATAGIGTNMYLAKIVMDIVAKHIPADKDGARIAELTEQEYRRQLWSHRPLTDFWRVGKGYEDIIGSGQ